MLSMISNILGVARYERKMLIRTTKFRILGGLGVLIPILIGGALAIAEANGVELPSISGLSAYLPFYIYSYLQTVVIAFIVGDFRAADERANIYEVIAARPLTTAELVAGKYLGVVGALVTLTLGILVVTVGIQAAKISITGAPFTLKPYLIYMFLMNLPALIYMSAVTFFLGSLLRRQTAVALVVIAYAMSVLFFLGSRYGGIYDFGAFFAPLFYSDLMGLGDITRVVDQRLFYLALALCFFGLSIERYPRLSQSRVWTWMGRGLAIVGLGLAYGLYDHMERQDLESRIYRKDLLATQTRYADRPLAEITHYDLQVDLMQDGVPLKGTAKLQLKNSHEAPLDTLIFSLNPGLVLKALRGENGEEIPVVREESVIKAVPPAVLAPGAETHLTFFYEGDIDRDGFDLKRTNRNARLKKNSRNGPPMRKGDLTAWIRENTAFLPPRSRWYPVTGVDYGYGEEGRPQSFATASIAVSAPAGLEVITQGKPEHKEQASGRFQGRWKVETPVPVFSLNAGNYQVYKKQIYGIECAIYVHPSHKRQVEFFADAEEQVAEALEQLLDAVVNESTMPYPYGQLSVVEVPFQVQWYYEGWEETGSLTQPGVLMIEEDVLLERRFNRDFKRFQQRSRGNRDPSQIKKDLLVRAIFDVFFSAEGRRGGLYRSPVVQLWSFNRNFQGEHHSLMKRGLPLYLQEDLRNDLQSALFSRGGGRGGFRGRGRGGFGRSTQTSSVAWDTLVAKMKQRSFADLDPEEESRLYRQVLDAKGPAMFKMMEAVMGETQFRGLMQDMEEDYKYKDVTFEAFEKAAVGDTTQNDEKKKLQRLVHDWVYSTEVPGYTLTRVIANKVDDGFGLVVYQLIVRIRNGEPGRGFVQISAMGRGDEAVKGVEIEGGQEVEVSMILFDRPFRVMVEPFFARNRRPLMSPVHVPDKVTEGFPEPYVREVSEADVSTTELIVDNDDEGFFMPVRRVRRFLRPELQGGNWREQPMPMAFGRYETNFRRKPPGDGAQPALWKTPIPHTGEYDVAYYFIDPRMARRFSIASSFQLAVFHGGKVDTLEMVREQLKGGWNLLGRFHFEAGEEAIVELSDLASGHLYADAIRWRYFDPDNPQEEYEMPSWNFGGRGGRGGRGGPGGGNRGGGRGPGGDRGGGGGFGGFGGGRR
ncbi:MAG: hypothetical protein O7G87_11855 [bacterium]|nr:hypothetical protein [bacterium]